MLHPQIEPESLSFRSMRLLSIVLCTSLGAAIYLWGGTKPVPSNPRFFSEQERSSRNPNGLKAIVLGSRKTSVRAGETDVDSACAMLWDNVRSLDLQSLTEDVFQGARLLPTNGACSKLPAEISSTHKWYLESCAPFISKEIDKQEISELDEKAKPCFQSLVAYRSAIGNWLSKGIPLSEIRDLSILGDKLMHGAFASMRGDESPVSEIRTIADRVNELNPNIYATSKISAVGNLMDVLHEPTPEGWTKARQALEKLEQFQQNDPELNMLGLWVRTEGIQPAKLREEARRIIDENPQSGLGYFYMAFAESGLGNREAVESLFLSAVEAEPKNPTFARALESVRAKRPVFPPFNFDFSFKMDEVMERG